MLVNAMSPYEEGAAPPPVSVVSPLKSCQAQKPPSGVLNPSGVVPVGDMMTYWTKRLDAGVVLPKCAAALTASAAIWCPVAAVGAGAELSYQIPASTPPWG